MKLKLEHIDCYFKYGLKGKFIDLHDIVIEADYQFGILTGLNFGNVVVDQFTPILHPLSEYISGITGGDVKNKLKCDLSVVHEIWNLHSGDVKLEDIKLTTYNAMCRNHIDFNNLIDKGLAIDINTL